MTTTRSRVSSLSEELHLIEDEDLRSWVVTLLDQFPNDGLWEKPAVYNNYPGRPPDERGPKGLLRHTKRVVRVAALLCDQGLLYINKDVVIAACILHDLAKWGVDSVYSPRLVKDHAKLATNWIEKTLPSGDVDPQKLLVVKAVRTHMGIFGDAEIPTTPEERMVAWADAVAAKYRP